MKSNNAKIGSGPSKADFGNTPDKPDNIKSASNSANRDKIAEGACSDNLKKPNEKGH